jgi:hypothetical protein
VFRRGPFVAVVVDVQLDVVPVGARALAAILWSKVTSAPQIRHAIAMLSALAVLTLRSIRRKNVPAALTSADIISSRCVTITVHMSKAEKPQRASSDVI